MSSECLCLKVFCVVGDLRHMNWHWESFPAMLLILWTFLFIFWSMLHLNTHHPPPPPQQICLSLPWSDGLWFYVSRFCIAVSSLFFPFSVTDVYCIHTAHWNMWRVCSIHILIKFLSTQIKPMFQVILKWADMNITEILIVCSLAITHIFPLGLYIITYFE